MVKDEPWWSYCKRKYGHTEGEILTAFGYQPQAVYEERLRVEICRTEDAFGFLEGMLEVMRYTGVYKDKGLKLEFNYDPSFPAALIVVQDFPPEETNTEQPENDKEVTADDGSGRADDPTGSDHDRLITVL